MAPSTPLQGPSAEPFVGVQQGAERPAAPPPPPGAAERSCARCGGPLPIGPDGLPRPLTRYCSAGCRQAAVRERRATARADQIDALGLLQDGAAQILRGATQLQDAAERIERALRTLGLHPLRPRGRGAAPTGSPGQIPGPDPAGPPSQIPDPGIAPRDPPREIGIPPEIARGAPGDPRDPAGDEAP